MDWFLYNKDLRHEIAKGVKITLKTLIKPYIQKESSRGVL